MKTIAVFERFRLPASLRSAWLIIRACRPTNWSPISPSISARGVSAATESMTIRSTAPARTSTSAISSACSPVSGCETSSWSMSSPSRFAYCGSSACSASMIAPVPPIRCASPNIWSAKVVLPDDSAPNNSMIRPRGMPPTPSAMSSANEPEGIVSTFCRGASPKRISAPSPNCFSTAAIASANARSRSPPAPPRAFAIVTPPVRLSLAQPRTVRDHYG